MKTVALFLPHLDVSGGLGMHCRTLAAALDVADADFRFVVFSPQDPQRLFPNADLELFDRAKSRLQFQSLDIPAGFRLAEPLDPILNHLLKSVKPDLLYCSYYTGMASTACPQIVAFHDAGFLENPVGFGETAIIRKRTVQAIEPAITL